ncbi:SGNH hydrolase [Coccomyxa subellipsoidea C-169]|uniref:SGNH hydrolase n=1 Tax=Coccomyxa subellipsoidea (strain C-169) TaxID=574566 RepID=I0YXW4_COCSC|nr:SGNH hydrolase [Coccomyxa subellipsoidea C-169]EIE23233.1 SGNH hydrolase [Coccomyxa subellipsoidea C-169]|eukprot:XP_005647777.1 SGNH hydrolase [Coccomyxa subellipsoidea C-169]
MQGYDVVIYGDSISENWRGTSGGLPYIRKDNTSSRPDPNFVAADMRAAFLETLGQRLLNGQTPKVDPKVAVVLIGTNDLYAATQCAAQDEDQLKSAVKTIVTGFQQLLAAMRQGMPSTHIVVQALYPRGEDMEDNMFELTRSDPFMHYISCGEEFVTPTSDAIVKEYLPDGLHPNAEGLRLIAECLTPLLQKLTSSNATTNAIQPAQNRVDLEASASELW